MREGREDRRKRREGRVERRKRRERKDKRMGGVRRERMLKMEGSEERR